MTDAFHGGIGFYIAETTNNRIPYFVNYSGTAPTFASNVMTIGYTGATPEPGFNNLPTTLSAGNLLLIVAVGTQDWGGSVGDSEYFYFGMGMGLKFKMSSASGWKIMATNNAGTEVAVGSTEYAWASSANVSNISVIRESSRIRVFVNGTKEIDATGVSSTNWNLNSVASFFGATNSHAGKFMYIGQILRCSTDVADRYLDPSGFASAKVIGNAAGTDSDFSTVTPGGTNAWDDVDDWNSGASDEDTTIIQDAGTNNGQFRHYFATATATCANTLGLSHYMRCRPAVASKSTDFYSGVGDGSGSGATGKVEVKTYGAITSTYASVACRFPFDGTWTLANLELGIYHDVLNNGADIGVLTALEAEVFGCTFASDPTGGAGPRTYVF